MKVNVKKVAMYLFDRGVIESQIEVATGRKNFWAHFGPSKPVQIIATDGATRQHPTESLGVMEYELVGDCTYVLVIERCEASGRWHITYAYFCHKHRLDVNKLRAELRNLSGLSHNPVELERILDNMPL